jgi:hypothetical protein
VDPETGSLTNAEIKKIWFHTSAPPGVNATQCLISEVEGELHVLALLLLSLSLLTSDLFVLAESKGFLSFVYRPKF